MIYWRRVLPNHADIVSDYGNQEKAIKLQMQVLNHSIEKKDSANIAIAHASLARYYLLQDNLKEAEIQLHLSKENINEAFRNNIAMSSYMVLLQSIFNYAKNKHINIMNWANFINSLQENANNKQKITDDKEEVKRLLNEKEIQLCCLLKANFSTKEISIVTQQGIRTVYQRKTVIRQKLGIEEKGDIAEYLSTLSKKEPL
ncbi:MAG: hypothetical protein IKB63_03410 [Parabacteroides sp.]|nr:hypothetical protein [Parabacteroides sp.]